MEAFYTKFRFEVLEQGDDRCIGVAHFEETKLWYPQTAVVKVLRRREEGSKEKELTIQSMNAHPNVVRLYAYYETESAFVLFLEHGERGSVFQCLISSEGERIAQSRLVPMMEDIAAAVQGLHANNIVHRDIKPRNVFVTRSNICKLGDFGSAKAVATLSDAAQYSLPKGTTSYMSPHKLSRFARPALEDRSYSDDIWALGKTFFEMCIGTTDDNLLHICGDEEKLSIYVMQEVTAKGYNHELAGLITLMLYSDSITTAEDVCMGLRNLNSGSVPRRRTIASAPKCRMCKTTTEVVNLQCSHALCTHHFLDQLRHQLVADSTKQLTDLKCLRCERPIALELLKSHERQLPPELVPKLQKLIQLSEEMKCVCGEMHPRVQMSQDPPQPYVYKCKDCGKNFCSWCNEKNGHKSLFNRSSKCPQFPYYSNVH